MATLRFRDFPFSIRKLHFMRLESISFKSVLIFLIFNIPISLHAQIFNWGGGNFGSQSLQSFFIENDISNLEKNRDNRSKLPYPNPAHINETNYIPIMKSDFWVVCCWFMWGKSSNTSCSHPENNIKNLTKGIYFYTISNHQD